MKWFYNLKVAQKLTALIIVMVLFMGIVGYIGISNLQEINSYNKSIYEMDLMA
jgi:methyl-accepting chemotaxis protein